MLFCVLPHERVGASLKGVSPLFSNHNVPDSHCPQSNHQSVSAYQPSGCSDLRRLQSSTTDRLSDASSLTSALKQPTLIPTALFLTRLLRFCWLYLSFTGCRFVLRFSLLLIPIGAGPPSLRQLSTSSLFFIYDPTHSRLLARTLAHF